MSIKKLFLICAFLSISILPFLVNVPTAKALTLEDISAQITALQAQITKLQQQLAELQKVQKIPSAPETVADEILVKFKPDVAKDTETAILNEHSLSVKSEIPKIGVKVLKVNPAARDAVIAALSKRNEVAFAEKNQIRKVSDFLPNDPYWKTGWKWELTQGKVMHAPEAWGVTTGSSSVSIAILDTGIDVTHQDLAGKIVSSANFTDAATAGDVNSHGTHVAGIAAASTNNSTGVASIGFNSTLFNAKVCDDIGYCYDSDITRAIIWAADNGAKVINMSFGGNGAASALEDAVNYAWSKGVVLVGAAGNYGNTTLFYPAAFQNVIAVAATDVTDQLTPYSNRGEWVDVAAPGDSIWSTVPNNGYNYKAGTSMAAPEVAGLAGLVLTRVTDTNGDSLLNDEVRTCIQTTAEDPYIGGVSLRSLISNGRINAYKAVTCGSTPPADTIAPTVSITSPANGSTVSGSVNVAANASDNVSVARVEFYIDSVLKSTDTTSPYGFTWDSTTIANGNHSILAKAYDTTNNVGTSSTITVTVNNVVETLSVSLIANPSSGTAPLTTAISADVSGTASGTISYSFWWNCNNFSTNVGTSESACGVLPAPTPGSCSSNTNGYKCNAVNTDPQSISHAYSSAGTFTAKVIVERGTALPTEARTIITVSPSIPGNITGIVSSSTGGVISGAKVSIAVNGKQKTYLTDTQGIYTILNLNPADYSLKFSAKSYINQTVSVTVTSSSTTVKNITLQKR